MWKIPKDEPTRSNFLSQLRLIRVQGPIRLDLPSPSAPLK
jgi:hypothetical protein